MKINNNIYEEIKNYREAFNEEEFLSKFTDYFYDYDYIVGDIAYNTLRLKGFYKKNSPKVNKYNNYDNVEKYLKEYCAPECKYYIIEKRS